MVEDKFTPLAAVKHKMLGGNIASSSPLITGVLFGAQQAWRWDEKNNEEEVLLWVRHFGWISVAYVQWPKWKRMDGVKQQTRPSYLFKDFYTQSSKRNQNLMIWEWRKGTELDSLYGCWRSVTHFYWRLCPPFGWELLKPGSTSWHENINRWFLISVHTSETNLCFPFLI